MIEKPLQCLEWHSNTNNYHIRKNHVKSIQTIIESVIRQYRYLYPTQYFETSYVNTL
jgi:hypothetical protein